MQTTEVLGILNKTLKPSQQMAEKLRRWRDVYYGISLHTTGACPRFNDPATGRAIVPPAFFGNEYQYLFDNYLLSRHPRESEATRNWRYSQYRPLTRAPFAQITQIVAGAIFQDSNYVLEVQDEHDNAYIWGNHFAGHDLVGYFAAIGIRNITEDPNGLFVRIPRYAYYEQKGAKVEVDILFVNTKDILYYTATDLIFRHGGFAWWIDKQTIWRFSYDGQKRKYFLAKADASGYYAHMLGRLPVSVAGGEWNTHGYYDSYFSKAKAAADDFISSYSAAQLVDKEASHPFIVEASAECADCNGRGHVQKECKESPTGYELANCATCGGTGQVSRNPGQRIILPHEQMKDGAPVQIINPDVAINTHHRDVCAQVMSLLIEALHLQKTDAAQSGVAKAIDQERLYKFISNISNHIFDKLLHDTLGDILAYRHVATDGGQVHPAQFPFHIVKPTQFRIKTSADLLSEYSAGVSAGLPSFIRQRMALDFIDKQYGGDELMKKKAAVIMQLDELSVLSIDEVLRLREMGVITVATITYSRRLPQVLDALVRDFGEGWFLAAPFELIKLEVDKEMEEYVNVEQIVKTLLN